MRSLIFTATLIAAAATTAWADAGTRITANVPFDYSVLGVQTQGGQVSFNVTSSGRVKINSPAANIILLGNHSPKVTPNARLVFHVFNGKKVLRAIDMGTSGSVQFLPTREEREWTALGLQARIEVIAIGRHAD